MPPHILYKMLDSKNEEIRQSAIDTFLQTSRLRGQRSIRAISGVGVASAPSDGRRSVFDCRHSERTSDARLARTEQGPTSTDTSVNSAFDGLGVTRDFYRTVLDRNSIDDAGMRLDAYVHKGIGFNNALWDGQQMLFGDGDGRRFGDFTASLDVIAHELTHGVTEHTAGLDYHNQPGALNESISDVFGSLVKQWSLGQSADQADWLIGADVFTPGRPGDALRSLKAPGTAYSGADIGDDPQPDHMKRYAALPDTQRGDFGGVHINSGIPNKAFYLVASGVGGNAWEAPGAIWYEALRASSRTTQFQEFANTTHAKATQLFGPGAVEARAVADAWAQVGLPITPLGAHAGARRDPALDRTDPLAALSARIEALASDVASLASAMEGLRARDRRGSKGQPW